MASRHVFVCAHIHGILSMSTFFMIFICASFPGDIVAFSRCSNTNFICPMLLITHFILSHVLLCLLLKNTRAKWKKVRPKDNNTHGAYYIIWLKFLEPNQITFCCAFFWILYAIYKKKKPERKRHTINMLHGPYSHIHAHLNYAIHCRQTELVLQSTSLEI